MFYLILAGAGYYFYKTRSNQPPIDLTMVVPDGQPSVAQPSQINPMKYIYDPRVDTANQPWYAGSSQFQDASQGITVVADSVKDFWYEMDNHNQDGQKDPYQIQIVGEETKQAYTTDVAIFSKAGG